MKAFGLFYILSLVSSHALLAVPPEQSDLPAAMVRVGSYGKLGPYFIKNRGQLDQQVAYYLNGVNGTTYLTRSGLVFRISGGLGHGEAANGGAPQPLSFRIRPLGANEEVKLTARDPLPARVHYFVGRDPKKWRTEIPMVREVVYQELYPGIDLRVYGTGHQMEYDFVVSPGAKPADIRLAFDGVSAIEVDRNGDLVIRTALGERRHRKPTIYQEIDGRRHSIAGGFQVAGLTAFFDVKEYDHGHPLIIDPLVVAYSTFLGGSGSECCELAIAVDSDGYAYVAGHTDSEDVIDNVPYPAPDPKQVYVAKISQEGNRLIYFTYLGGSDRELASGIAVNAAGYAHIVGYTTSDDWPMARGEYEGAGDAFVAVLDGEGKLSQVRYLGGGGWDRAADVAIDGENYVYVTGFTSSRDFPTNGFQMTYGGGDRDVFVTKLTPTADLVYSTYLGGWGYDYGHGIAVDEDGYTFVTGETNSRANTEGEGGFPTASPVQGELRGARDAFLSELGPDGLLMNSTYLGGEGSEWGYDIAIDALGSPMVTGTTSSKWEPDTEGFPVVDAIQTNHGGGTFDAFITRFSYAPGVDALAISYSSYLGGSFDDQGFGIATTSGGVNESAACVTGVTASEDFPGSTTSDDQGLGARPQDQSPYGGNGDAFVVAVRHLVDAPEAAPSVQTPFFYTTYLGGTGDDKGTGIAADQNHSCYVAGTTPSRDFPVSATAFQDENRGRYDGFVTKYTLVEHEERRATH